MTRSQCFALRFTGWAILALALLVNADPGAKESVTRPAAGGSAQALIEAHDCSDTVANPKHSVVTVDGMTRYVGQRMTDRAIEQAVFGVDHGLIVHGFCS